MNKWEGLAGFEWGFERGKRDGALRPLHRRRERQPNACDNAVGSPCVQNVVYRFSLMFHHTRFRFHGDQLDGAHRLEVTQISMRHRTDSTGTTPEASAHRR